MSAVAMPAVGPALSARTRVARMRRVTLPGAMEDRLFFAQVREDPMLEIEALGPVFGGRIAIVGSGGCTALSLVACGARDVVAVDLNTTQNHLTELKAVAVAALPVDAARVFLGAASGAGDKASRGRPGAELETDVRKRAVSDARQRVVTYARLRAALSPAARAWWDARLDDIRAGVLGAGVSERLIRMVVRTLRLVGHGPRRLRRLLASRTLEGQRAFFDREWNTRAWRTLIRLALGRRRLSGVYDPAFFDRVENESFGDHFLRRIAHGLTELPVGSNYFLRFMLTGSYAERGSAVDAASESPGAVGALPPWLTTDGADVIGRSSDRLTIVDGGMTDWLRTQPDASIDGFSLSNICEWLGPEAIDDLFAEIARTAVPGSILCFRNFLGWTEVPAAWQHTVVEDRERGAAMIERDRSLLQRRFAICTVCGDGT